MKPKAPESMDLSYAQNMEDMHLDMIFSGQDPGFYIDIGGGHPVADNVSFRCYLAGWQGLVLEPQTQLHRLYGSVRPRDIALDMLVGREQGSAAFHVVDKLHGFSTTVEAHALGATGFGTSYDTQTRAMTTLAALCRQHAPAAGIDWLKIDVEGAEEAVLAGHDWSHHRPRVILIEAIAPGSMEPSHQGWEPILLRVGYGLAFFDGLNRWYVAQEAAALATRFPSAYRDWGSVRHLYDHGRARERADHPDHALASALMGLDPAGLPLVDRATIFGFLTKNVSADDLHGPASAAMLDRFAHLWLGGEPHRYDPASGLGQTLEDALEAMIATDAFRAALGRIAAAHDGGFIMEG
ncbi:MAG: FkbM family methyltransferase [Hyphomicrobiales bacterium]|nr:FkbM family methyltransferase [Hyphomicrobiales bacterium]